MLVLETEMKVVKLDRVCDACDDGVFRTQEVTREKVDNSWCWRMIHVCDQCRRYITEHSERVVRWPKYENRGVQ